VPKCIERRGSCDIGLTIFIMYYQLNNFTGRLIGSRHIQPYFPIVSTKFLSALHASSRVFQVNELNCEVMRLWYCLEFKREAAL
jgi:hypothetical protein